VTLGPASGEEVLLRLVEVEATPGYAPLKTFGWNAAELHVADVYGLAEQILDSPYKILGGPRDLLDNGTVVALQARGPSDEIFYLTQISSDNMQRTYGTAGSAVGRVFIVVLGCSDIETTRKFYGGLSTATPRPRKFAIRVLAAAHGLDPMTTKFPIASAVLGSQFRIEFDGYPDSASIRPIAPEKLPPGLAMVSFHVDSIGDIDGAIAHEIDGQRMAMMCGPDGEWLELIERPSD
jgi:catechol 2,3-dioxygenase-like lactoylglutathione lyase family enzyme